MTAKKHYKGILMLALLIVGVPLLCWQLALSSTYKTVREASRLRKTIVENASAVRTDTKPSPVISGEDLITDGLILDRIAVTAEEHRAKVVEYQPYVNTQNGELSLLSAEITVAGGYTSIVRIIDELENNVPECVVKSVDFGTVGRLRDRSVELRAVIIVQQLISSAK